MGSQQWHCQTRCAERRVGCALELKWVVRADEHQADSLSSCEGSPE